MAIDLAYIVPHPVYAVPEIGQGEEGKIAAITEGYRRLSREIASYAPDTIVICSPHTESYSDYFQFAEGDVGIGSFGDFGHREINFRFLYDNELADAIAGIASRQYFPAGYENAGEMSLDHGSMVPLYFINQNYTSYKVVRLGISGLSYMEHYQVGMIINKACEKLGRRAVYIASGDLSHVLAEDGKYGYAEEGRLYTEKAVNCLKEGNFAEFLEIGPGLVRAAKVCGHRSFLTLLGTFEGRAVETDFFGEGESKGVGYAMIGYRAKGKDNERRYFHDFLEAEKKKAHEIREHADPYAKLCYEALETYLKTGKVIRVPKVFPEEGKSRKGCFVTIRKWGNGRGCIGTIQSSKRNLGEEIIANAIEAATDDPRFPVVKTRELDYLTFEVDVVEGLESCSMGDLDPKEFGLVITSGTRRGVLLPGLSNIRDAETQLEVARRKAGIEKGTKYSLSRFRTAKHV